MTKTSFLKLCDKLQSLEKMDTNFKPSIPLEKRVAIALYCLGSSSEYRTIANLFGVGKATVGEILIEFCEGVWSLLKPKYLNFLPVSQDLITESVTGFQLMGFPQCFGAIGEWIIIFIQLNRSSTVFTMFIDGCHIEVSPPSEQATDYYNFKGWYSMVLLALVDYRQVPTKILIPENKWRFENLGSDFYTFLLEHQGAVMIQLCLKSHP